jgi:hypothetical protein
MISNLAPQFQPYGVQGIVIAFIQHTLHNKDTLAPPEQTLRSFSDAFDLDQGRLGPDSVGFLWMPLKK